MEEVWQSRCLQVVLALLHADTMFLFSSPVNLTQMGNVIERPMDLGTVLVRSRNTIITS